MPCCGGKNGGKPITRLRYGVGRVAFAGIRTALHLGLSAVGLVIPRFREIARFWELLSADWARAIREREGIALIGAHEPGCLLRPPSHFDATGEDRAFGADWSEDEALFDDAGDPSPAVPAATAEVV